MFIQTYFNRVLKLKKSSRKNKSKKNNSVIVVSENEKEWDSELKIVDECPYMSGYKVKIAKDVYDKIIFLNSEIKDTEWAGYLYGKWIDEKTVEINDIKIPEQEVTSASVDIKETDEKAIGTIHKHPWSGGTSFSGIDEKYVMSNHDVSLLIDSDNKITAKIRRKLPCGYYTLASAEVYVTGDEELGKWIREAKKKIKEKVERITYYTGRKCPYTGREERCPYKNYMACPYYNNDCPYSHHYRNIRFQEEDFDELDYESYWRNMEYQ